MLTILPRGDYGKTDSQRRGSLRGSAYHTSTPGSSISPGLTFGPALGPGVWEECLAMGRSGLAGPRGQAGHCVLMGVPWAE